MYAAAIIVFRESLEAALIIGVMLAATRGIAQRGRWVWGGVLLGLAGASLVAYSMEMIGSMLDGMGQEYFNIGILLFAVGMLAWHNIWMASHGRELAEQVKTTARAVSDGRSERSIILVVIALAVMREGSETVLFLYGLAGDGANGMRDMLAGGGLGLFCGAAVAALLYAGLLRVPLRWFFAVTGAMVLLLAASMASQAARLLMQVDVLPSLASPLWDTSAVLPQDGVVGTLLHGLIGYEAQPDGTQVLVYVATLLLVATGMLLVSRRTAQPEAVSLGSTPAHGH